MKTAKSSFAKRAITSYRLLATRIAANVTFVVTVAYNSESVKTFFKILGYVVLAVLVGLFVLCAFVGLIYFAYLLYAMAGEEFP